MLYNNAPVGRLTIASLTIVRGVTVGAWRGVDNATDWYNNASVAKLQTMTTSHAWLLVRDARLVNIAVGVVTLR